MPTRSGDVTKNANNDDVVEKIVNGNGKIAVVDPKNNILPPAEDASTDLELGKDGDDSSQLMEVVAVQAQILVCVSLLFLQQGE